ncbi:unnamed protein product [Triticum turgidum subsp. durum]|uniref:NAC domain-containing protein n=1 Tax=Triticum turgidum subsp. durum TaxID=4567 RepID=A0A9R0ZTK0_TRITD|nr:unnamed protein product [Triticum turgidum subsp. durum]
MADHLQVQRQQLKFPQGFRFHPTDVEIITSYLVPKVLNKAFDPIAIGEVDLNKCEPWELPEKAKMGIFHKSTGLKKVVVSSYAIPMSMPMGAEEQHAFHESGTLPPFMGYGASSSLVPPSSVPTSSSYQLHDVGARSSMMGSAVLPMMNDHYFRNHHYQNMATPPRPLVSFYHHDHHHQQQQQQQHMIQMPMQMQIGADEGLMIGVEPGSGPSSIVSQEDTLARFSSNDVATTADEISSVNMGTDDIWKY